LVALILAISGHPAVLLCQIPSSGDGSPCIRTESVSPRSVRARSGEIGETAVGDSGSRTEVEQEVAAVRPERSDC
jgi:hypothetical protein